MSITNVFTQNCMIKIMTVSTAIVDPAYPICIANFVNFACNTDCSFLWPPPSAGGDDDDTWFSLSVSLSLTAF